MIINLQYNLINKSINQLILIMGNLASQQMIMSFKTTFISFQIRKKLFKTL